MNLTWQGFETPLLDEVTIGTTVGSVLLFVAFLGFLHVRGLFTWALPRAWP